MRLGIGRPMVCSQGIHAGTFLSCEFGFHLAYAREFFARFWFPGSGPYSTGSASLGIERRER